MILIPWSLTWLVKHRFAMPAGVYWPSGEVGVSVVALPTCGLKVSPTTLIKQQQQQQQKCVHCWSICVRLPRQHRCALQKVKKAIYQGKDTAWNTAWYNFSREKYKIFFLTEYYQTNFKLVSGLQSCFFSPNKSAPKCNRFLCPYFTKLVETQNGSF